MNKKKVVDSHILSIVQHNDIAEQSDLQEILKERGHDIPQATLSRRLKSLKIAKVGGVYKVIDYDHPHIPLVLNMQISESGIMVMHTHPGQASSLGYYLDQKYVNFGPRSNKKTGILGTIAGDDTVLVIIKSAGDIEKVLALLHEDFPYLGHTLT